MAKTQKRKTKPQETSPPACRRRSRYDAANTGRLSAGGGGRVDAGEVAMVRRSSIAPLLVCGLCGGILREATTVSECLHSFCAKCISQKFKDEDNKRCPTCNIDLGCDPKLRVDCSLQCISSVIFPTKRKMEEFSSLHTELVSLPSLTSQAYKANHSGYKMDVHLVDDPMNTVDTVVEGSTALSPAASQSEAEKSAARILEMIEVYIDQTQASEAKTAKRREEFENKRAQRADACERAIIVEDGVQREFEMSQSTAKILQTIDVYIGRIEALKADNARLREELDNERADKATLRTILGLPEFRVTNFSKRAKVFEQRLEEQTERLQIESKRSQEIGAAQREALRENRALKQEMAEKNEELSNLKNSFTMTEKRSTQVQQRNEVLEDQIDHVNRLLEAEESDTRALNEQLHKTVIERNMLLTELETNSDGLAKIQGCIHKSLTARISRLKGIAAMTNLAHYQHLLARMDALGQVKEHVPKMLETIEVATSLTAYSLAAATLIRLRAYHGDDFDLQRLVMPLHLNRQDYARIRNAIDPLAAKVAQKYRICKH